MITKFWGKNFGKIGDFSVDLDPLTILVGPNASGKSTFLRGLRLVAMLNRNPLYGRSGALRLGYRATIEELFPKLSEDAEFRLGVQCKNSNGLGSYEIALKYGQAQQLQVTHEKAEWKPKSGKLFSYDSGKDEISFDYRGSTISSAVPRGSSLSFLFYNEWRKGADIENKLASLYELTSCFAPFYVYRFSPSAIARPVELGTPVAHDGMGLPAELDRMLGEEREVFDRLVEKLTSTFPHIKKVNVITIKGGSTPISRTVE